MSLDFLLSQNIERSYGKNFVDALNELTEKLLRQFDACLTVDDIQRGSKLWRLHILTLNRMP